VFQVSEVRKSAVTHMLPTCFVGPRKGSPMAMNVVGGVGLGFLLSDFKILIADNISDFLT